MWKLTPDQIALGDAAGRSLGLLGTTQDAQAGKGKRKDLGGLDTEDTGMMAHGHAGEWFSSHFVRSGPSNLLLHKTFGKFLPCSLMLWGDVDKKGQPAGIAGGW